MNYLKWNNLDKKKETNKKKTIRTSYKMKDGAVYQLYGLPGKKPGDQGEIFMQSQRGFE